MVKVQFKVSRFQDVGLHGWRVGRVREGLGVKPVLFETYKLKGSGFRVRLEFQARF